MRRYSRAKRIFIMIPIGLLAIFVFGIVVMWLWNNVLVTVLHVSTISFWQGLGLLVLSKIFFGSFSGGRGYRRDCWKERMMWKNMTPEQREKLREEWRNRSGKWGYKSWDSEFEPQQG